MGEGKFQCGGEGERGSERELTQVKGCIGRCTGQVRLVANDIQVRG